MKPFLLTLCLMLGFKANAQTYKDSILRHRQHYKEEFISEERSPLKENDTSYLRFFKPDSKYRVLATFMPTPESKEFDMPTYSGKKKMYKQYGILTFRVNNKKCSLLVYQSQTLINDPKYKDHLFVPFTDGTTYKTTYGGGRYIDLLTTDIQGNKVIVDFNKAYNPYCAYADGYNCPIPPVENRLGIAIKAGEKLFGRETKH